jgi:hypothetical protein
LHLLAAQALCCWQQQPAAAAHSPPITHRTSRGYGSHGDTTPPEASGRADDIAVCGTGAGAEGDSALVADTANFCESSSERQNASIADSARFGERSLARGIASVADSANFGESCWERGVALIADSARGGESSSEEGNASIADSAKVGKSFSGRGNTSSADSAKAGGSSNETGNASIADSATFSGRSSERVNATIADVSKKGNAWYIRTRAAFRSRLAGWVAEIEDELSSVILNIPSDGSAGSGGDPSDALMTGECCRHIVLKESYTKPHLCGLSGAISVNAGNPSPFDLRCRKDQS